MKTVKYFSLIFVFSSSMFAQLDSTIIAKTSITEYSPFNENIEMVFNSSIGETIQSVERKDDLYRVTNTSDKFTYTQTFLKKEDGIYLTRTEQNISTILYSKEADISYSERILLIPQPLKEGDKWSWSGFQYKNKDTTSVSIIGEAISNEVIEVPAGKFKTIKIKLFFQEKDGEETELYQWLDNELCSVKTKTIINGSGIMAFTMSIIGYDEIDSELIKINNLEFGKT